MKNITFCITKRSILLFCDGKGKLENSLKLRSKGTNIPVRCFNSADEVFTQDLLEGVYDKIEINEKDNENKRDEYTIPKVTNFCKGFAWQILRG
jgi:hypothetical protein